MREREGNYKPGQRQSPSWIPVSLVSPFAFFQVEIPQVEVFVERMSVWEQLLEEIGEIPQQANLCIQENSTIKLPKEVPYIGMGSSYYASLSLFYAGANINPLMSSEFHYYLATKKVQSFF